MIVRQQAELQKVKEQLLLARLGILQPVINVSTRFMIYTTVEEGYVLGRMVLYDRLARLILAILHHQAEDFGKYASRIIFNNSYIYIHTPSILVPL